MDGSIQPVMPIGNNDGLGFGGSSGLWLFAILALMWGGNGFFGNGGTGNANAIQADVNRGFDNQNLQAQTRDILGAVTSGTAQSVAATNQTFHDTLGALNDKYGELARDIAGIQVAQAQALANQNQCCCETKQLIQEQVANTNAMIAQNKYEAAMNLAGFEQRLMSKLDANKIDALQNRVNQLELQNAVSGVVRYPNSMSYNAGTSPFCNNGCGCGNI